MSKPNITVVTGGSSGIGAACVRHLAKRGDHVVSLDLPGTWDEGKMRDMGVTAYACNVTDDEGMKETAAMIEAKHGPYELWDKPFFFLRALIDHQGLKAETPSDWKGANPPAFRAEYLHACVADAIADTGPRPLTTQDEMREIAEVIVTALGPDFESAKDDLRARTDALMDRFPLIITVGGMLLGWIAGTMAVTDPALVNPEVLTQFPKISVSEPLK